MTAPSIPAVPDDHDQGLQVSPWIILLIVCLAQLMIVLDITVVNVALPSIQRDLNFSASDLQWVINSYTLMFGGFLLLGGRAGDLIGRKRLFVIGLVVFTVASLANGLAQSSTALILFRGLQGLGGALVSPVALSIITTTFAEGPERTKALGVWGAIAGAGSGLGLLIGGVLTELVSWEWIFFINVPIGLGTLLWALRALPESRAEERPEGFDLAGAVSVTAGLVVLVYAIVKAQAWGWGSGKTLGFAAVAIVLLAGFLVIESRSKAPLVNLSIFRIRTLATADAVFLFVAGGLFAMFYFSSLYIQEVLGYGALKAGFAFLPVTFVIIIFSGLAQFLVGKIGAKWVTLSGLVMTFIGYALLSRVSAPGTYLGDILPGLLLFGAGMGNVFVPMTLIATAGVSSNFAGLASGLFNTAQQVGGALGLAILSSLATTQITNHVQDLGRAPTRADQAVALTDGIQVAFTVGAGLIGIGAILTLIFIRNKDVAHLSAADMVVAA